MVLEEVENTSTYNDPPVTPFWFSFSRVRTFELGGCVVRVFRLDPFWDWAVVGVIVWDGSVRSDAGSGGVCSGGGRGGGWGGSGWAWTN
jgi:hypothetical protein